MPGRLASGAGPGRLLRSADFQRVLAAPQRARSPHFALHFLAGRPGAPSKPLVPELSTASAPTGGTPVDDLPAGCWLGTVLPKRHARRAVTRNLLRRQIHEAARRHHAELARGLWVLRLRTPFAPADFPSAASTALRQAARSELDAIFVRAAS